MIQICPLHFSFFFFPLDDTEKLFLTTNRNIGGSDCAHHELMAGGINFREEPLVARGGVTSGRRRGHITLIGSVRVREPERIVAYPGQGRLFIHWISFDGKILTKYFPSMVRLPPQVLPQCHFLCPLIYFFVIK